MHRHHLRPPTLNCLDRQANEKEKDGVGVGVGVGSSKHQPLPLLPHPFCMLTKTWPSLPCSDCDPTAETHFLSTWSLNWFLLWAQNCQTVWKLKSSWGGRRGGGDVPFSRPRDFLRLSAPLWPFTCKPVHLCTLFFHQHSSCYSLLFLFSHPFHPLPSHLLPSDLKPKTEKVESWLVRLPFKLLMKHFQGISLLRDSQ